MSTSAEINLEVVAELYDLVEAEEPELVPVMRWLLLASAAVRTALGRQVPTLGEINRLFSLLEGKSPQHALEGMEMLISADLDSLIKSEAQLEKLLRADPREIPQKVLGEAPSPGLLTLCRVHKRASLGNERAVWADLEDRLIYAGSLEASEGAGSPYARAWALFLGDGGDEH